jgi:ferritin-like metal-binding protein YciE
MSKLASLDDLFVRELQEAYDAEGQIQRGLPRLVKAATSPDLKTVFSTHGRQTDEHLYRLSQILEMLAVPVHGSRCEGVAALLAQSKKLADEIGDPEILDTALISLAQKLEHFEIATYGCLCTYAEMLGYDQARRLLGQTLEEEETTDMRLTELAETVINHHAVEGDSA